MTNFKKISSIILFVFAINFSQTSVAHDGEHVVSALQHAVHNSNRSEDEQARDVYRKPIQTLKFFGVKENSSVLEIMPGGGWYTKILQNYLAKSGKLTLVMGNSKRLKEKGFENLTFIEDSFKFEKTDAHGYVANLSGEGFGDVGADFALTFRNVHNLTSEARSKVNEAAFKALKPGGVFGVIGHSKRHMAPDSDQMWRREDPVQIIKEAVAAGFVFEDYSKLHYQPKDELVLDTTHVSLNKNSDRFTLKFRKPL